jgi:hypothetical protein
MQASRTASEAAAAQKALLDSNSLLEAQLAAAKETAEKLQAELESAAKAKADLDALRSKLDALRSL